MLKIKSVSETKAATDDNNMEETELKSLGVMRMISIENKFQIIHNEKFSSVYMFVRLIVILKENETFEFESYLI